MWSVMAADDEAYMREALQQLIPWADLNCAMLSIHANGKELVDAMEEGHPDIVITDIRMPEMDGLEVCRYVYERCPEAQVIVLSAYSDFAYAQTAMRYSACEYVLKVDVLEGLPRAIQKACAILSRQQREVKEQPPERADEGGVDVLYHQIVRYVERNYRSNVTLSGIADALHANPSYLSRLYKCYTGINLFDDILQRRIEKAKECLLASNWRVHEVAEYVGFEDAGYFSKVFKKQTGVSPKEFKNAREIKA